MLDGKFEALPVRGLQIALARCVSNAYCIMIAWRLAAFWTGCASVPGRCFAKPFQICFHISTVVAAGTTIRHAGSSISLGNDSTEV